MRNIVAGTQDGDGLVQVEGASITIDIDEISMWCTYWQLFMDDVVDVYRPIVSVLCGHGVRTQEGANHMDAEANPDAYKVNAAIRSIEAQQRKDAKAAAKAAKGAAGGGGKRVIEMDVGLGVVDLKTTAAIAKATAMAGDAVVGGESSEDTRESGGGRIWLPGQVGDTTARNAGIQELS